MHSLGIFVVGIGYLPVVAEIAGSWITAILAVIGAIALLLVIVVVGLFFWIRAKIKGIATQLGAMAAMLGGGVPTFRLELIPADPEEYPPTPESDAAAQAFLDAGFEPGGTWMEEEHEVVIRGFVHPQTYTMGAVYQHESIGVFSDVVGDFDDGTTLTVSNGKPQGMRHPDWSKRVNLQDADTAALLARFEQEAGGRGSKPCESFKAAMETAYNREMDWQIERGGPQADEIRQMAGDEEVTDEQVEMIRDAWESRIADFYVEDLTAAFKRSGQFSAVEWEEKSDRLLFTYDGCGTEMIIGRYVAHKADDYIQEHSRETEEDFDAYDAHYDELEAEANALLDGVDLETGIEALNERLPDDKRFERIGTISAKKDAVVWLEPGLPEIR